MDVFALRNGLIDAYREHATGFMRFRNRRILERFEDALDDGKLWPIPRSA